MRICDQQMTGYENSVINKHDGFCTKDSVATAMFGLFPKKANIKQKWQTPNITLNSKYQFFLYCLYYDELSK